MNIKFREGVGRLALAVLLTAVGSGGAGGQEFALRDGDSVVFYGDSITAQRLYTRFVEEAVLTRYPALHVRFVNAGVPGDTVFGGYAGAMTDRVLRDVAPFHPAQVTVMLGMNDGGYGYTPEATVHGNFQTGYDRLLDALHKVAPEARFMLIHPTPYDEVTHGTDFAGYAGLMDKVSEDVGTVAAAWEAKTGLVVRRADFHRPLAQALDRANAQFPQLAPLLIPDRIHPAEAAHWMMASALLSAWHMDPLVSRVVVDAKRVTVLDAKRSVVTKLEATAKGIRWTALEEALPLPLDLNNAMTAVLLGVSDIAQMDQQLLQVEGLTPGSYQLLIDGKMNATFSSEEWQRGVNLALLKTPMWEQARSIDFLEERRATLDLARFVLKSEVKVRATSGTAEDALQVACDELAATARTKIVPKPHDFEIRRQ